MVRSALAVALLALIVMVVGPAPCAADDVPDSVRKVYDLAREQFTSGNVKKSYSTISKGKAKAPLSVDFWELYVRIWRALDKSEDTLWTRVIGAVEAKHPDTTVFDMLRVRLATTSEERIECLKRVVEKKPDAVEPRLLLAREFVAQGDEMDAEELLDAVLEDEPGNELALVTKGDMMIESGFSRSALEFAEETLAEHDLPGLHDLAARAWLQVAENDESAVDKALEEAQKAVKGRPDPGYVLTLAGIWDLKGDVDKAVALLKTHRKAGPSADLDAMLGRLAFRSGDYATALKSLAAKAGEDLLVAKALSAAATRMGKSKECRAALAHVLRLGEDEKLWAAGCELGLGNTAAALKHLAGLDDEEAVYVRAWAHSWEGKTEEVRTLVDALARDGTRAGEEYLLLLVKARLFQKLGSKAGGVRKALIKASHKAGASKVPGATIPEFEESVAGVSHGFMMRHASYRRCLGGTFFSSAGMFPIAVTQIDGVPAFGIGVVAQSDCPRDEQRTFPFNAQKVEGEDGVTIVLEPDPKTEVWEAASTAFTEGCAALADGEWATADAAFGKALEQEATWDRARLFQAVAKVFGGGDAAAAADLAAKAADGLQDDWEGRVVAILIGTLAGKDMASAIKANATAEESFAVRYFDEL